jgi:hypothetical protein
VAIFDKDLRDSPTPFFLSRIFRDKIAKRIRISKDIGTQFHPFPELDTPRFRFPYRLWHVDQFGITTFRHFEKSPA